MGFMSDKFGEFYNDPFTYLENNRLTRWVLSKDTTNRKAAFVIAMFSLGAWIVFGFDSTPLQFIHVLYEGVPQLFLGKASLGDLGAIYNKYYGCEMHWSAFVIYGLMYWGLSRHFTKNLGITKSKNIAFTCSLVFLSVAIFEFFWMCSFATFQSQPWVITPRWPQLRIHLQNILFLTVGVIGVLYFWLDSFVYDPIKEGYNRLYRLRVDWKAFMLIGVSVVLVLLWIYYPWYVERFEVKLETGEVWRNSANFPQTLYTVDLNPTDNMNAGVWFFVENNWIHALNTIVKVMVTLTVFYIGMVKKVEDSE